MITVLKHGKYPKGKERCEKCECVFTFEREDTWENDIGIWVNCPDCGCPVLIQRRNKS